MLGGVRGEKSTKNAIFFVKKYCRQHQRKIWRIKEKLSLLQNATEESRARNCGQVGLGGRALVGGVGVQGPLQLFHHNEGGQQGM